MYLSDHLDTYASLLAIWYTGNIYIPLHPSYPKSRMENIIEVSNIVLILSHKNNSNVTGLNVAQIDCSDLKNKTTLSNLTTCYYQETDIVYILFTSLLEDKKLHPDTKILTLKIPAYSFEDVAHLSFNDFTTHEEDEYEWDGDIPPIDEIVNKCEDQEGCPALKGQVYRATLKYKLMDIYDFDQEGIISPTGKKEKRWAIAAFKKINKP